MTKHVQTNQDLAKAIKDFSALPLTEDEAAEAVQNLASFFKLLIEIENSKRK